MKIAFCCTSVEPGKDGVGDYVRRLALTLLKQGHQVALLAAKDRYVETAITESVPVPTLRLPTHFSRKDLTRYGGRFLREFGPDWLSVHVVIYGWQPKGLPFGLSQALRAMLPPSVRVQLMFHELSIGLSASEPLRQRLMGMLQQRFVLMPLASMPEVGCIHAAVLAYVDLLQKWGFSARHLPLFGNVPLFYADSASQEQWWMTRFSEPRDGCYVVGVFGAVNAFMLDAGMIAELQRVADERGKKLMFVSAGRGGVGERRFFEQLRRYPQISVRQLGEMSEHDLSMFLSLLDIGLSATPWDYIGKSGTAAAMIDHGIPVMVPRDDPRIEGARRNDSSYLGDRLLRPSSEDFGAALRLAGHSTPRDRTYEVASQFVNDLLAVGGISS